MIDRLADAMLDSRTGASVPAVPYAAFGPERIAREQRARTKTMARRLAAELADHGLALIETDELDLLRDLSRIATKDYGEFGS